MGRPGTRASTGGRVGLEVEATERKREEKWALAKRDLTNEGASGLIQ